MDTEAVVMKSDSASELTQAVKSLCEGKGYYSPTFFRLYNALRRQPNRLSDREKQVIELTAKGLSKHLLQYSSWVGIEPPAEHWDSQVMDGKDK